MNRQHALRQHPLRPRAVLVAALAAAGLHLLPGTAGAQSAYTLSTLGKPSGAGSILPTSLDNNGVVHGGMYQIKGYIADTPQTSCFLFCPQYQMREVSWPASTTNSTVTGKAGVWGFFGITGSGGGTQLGLMSTTASLGYQTWIPHPRMPGPVTGQNDFNLVANTLLAPVGVPAPIIDPSGYVPKATSDTGVIVGGRGELGTNGVPYGLAVVRRQGIGVVTLPGNLAAPQTSYLAVDINEAGVIVGQSIDWIRDEATNTSHSAYRPTQWVNDQHSFVGGKEMADLVAIAVNEAGQVLIGPSPQSIDARNPNAYLWSQGQAVKLEADAGKSVHPLAVNDKGTVVGCTRTIKDAAQLTRADLTAFIWRGGKVVSLEQEITAKGVRLPTGTRLGCPFAINNQGSILAYHYKISAPDTITWVRINAKP